MGSDGAPPVGRTVQRRVMHDDRYPVCRYLNIKLDSIGSLPSR